MQLGISGLVKYSPTRQNARLSRQGGSLRTGPSTELSTDCVDKGFYLFPPMAYPTFLWGLSALFRKFNPQAAAGGRLDSRRGCPTLFPCPAGRAGAALAARL